MKEYIGRISEIIKGERAFGRGRSLGRDGVDDGEPAASLPHGLVDQSGPNFQRHMGDG